MSKCTYVSGGARCQRNAHKNTKHCRGHGRELLKIKTYETIVIERERIAERERAHDHDRWQTDGYGPM